MDKNTNARRENQPLSQYYDTRDGHTFTTGGHVFHIFIHGGFNAMGLIGTECNGIGMVSVTDKQVVFDRHLCSGMGHANYPAKMAELARIIELDADELRAFFQTPGLRLRYDPLAPKKKTPLLNKALIQKFIDLAVSPGSCSYNAENKTFFHQVGKRILTKLAKELGLRRSQFNLHSNMGGIAVSGEITLHTDTHYIQLAQSCALPFQIMIRTCKDRKDYTGGANIWAKGKDLLDLPALAQRIKNTRDRGYLAAA